MKPTPPISISQVQKVTGISRTQIGRWIKLGYLTFADEVRNGVRVGASLSTWSRLTSRYSTPERWRETKAKVVKRKKGTP